jgi:hypothetical protein
MPDKITMENLDTLFAPVKVSKDNQLLVDKAARVICEAAREIILGVPEGSQRAIALEHLLRAKLACMSAFYEV